jgi:ComEC/Rec2-related protein
MTLVSLPLVYCNSLKADTGGTNLFSKNDAFRILALLSSALLCSNLACARVRSLTADAPLEPGVTAFTARVESVIRKRYRLDTVILFRPRVRGASSADNEAWHRGAAYISGGIVRPGDVIQFNGKPVAVKMPGGDSLSYSRSLLLQGIHHKFYLDAGSVTVTSTSPSLREMLRERLAARCDVLFERKTSSMVKALYFGNQDYIDKQTMNDFKRAGVLHILSASGHDVGVVAGVTMFMLGLVRINRKVVMAAAVLAVFLYLYITDMPVSLIRSCFMFFMYAAQRIFDRDVNIFNALFLSAAVIAMAYPHEIYSLGFQLSYAATLGILLFHARYRKAFSWLPAALAASLALTTAAQVLVLPLLLVRVEELNLAGLLSNIVVVPLMSLLLLASLAANASPIGIAAAGAARAADLIYFVNESAVSFLSGLNCHFHVEAAGPVLVAAFCLLALPLVLRPRGARFGSLSVLAAVAVAWIYMSAHSAGDRNGTTAIRHGRGLLLLVKSGLTLSVIGDLPEKRQLEPVRRAIASAACRNISLHILHPDYQNVTGYTFLVRQMAVRKCYLSGGFKVRKYTRRLFDILERDGIELIIHDCHSGGVAGEAVNGGRPAECACNQYRRISAEWRSGQVRGIFKKNGIRYLTLH